MIPNSKPELECIFDYLTRRSEMEEMLTAELHDALEDACPIQFK